MGSSGDRGRRFESCLPELLSTVARTVYPNVGVCGGVAPAAALVVSPRRSGDGGAVHRSFYSLIRRRGLATSQRRLRLEVPLPHQKGRRCSDEHEDRAYQEDQIKSRHEGNVGGAHHARLAV